MSAKIDFHLNPDSRFDGKWLKTDLEEALKTNQVLHYWNELLKDGELVVNDSHQSKISTPDSEFPGNDSVTLNNVKTKPNVASILHENELSQKLIDSWAWSKNNDLNSVTKCINLLQKEQQLLCRVVAGNTISSCRLQQRVVVAYRHFLALTKHINHQNSDLNKNWYKDVEANIGLLNSVLDKERSSETDIASPDLQKSVFGLARIGTRTALNFAFAFLRRAWRSGEDCDLCSELLQETLITLQELPEALLFDESKVSPVWTDVLEKSTNFLQQVVLCKTNGTTERKIPLIDRQYALQILLELALQRGTITAVLEIVLLLLTLSENNGSSFDNLSDGEECTSPMLPFLKRFQNALRSTFINLNDFDIWCDKDSDEATAVSPTECFLRFLELPYDDKVVLDLKLAAVIMMSYINRLIVPYLPTVAFLQNKKLHQMVFAWGWLHWESRNKSSLCDTLGELGVIKVVFADKYLFIISFDKKLYCYNYMSDPQNIEIISALSDKQITDVAAHPEGQHYLALTTEGTVYSWGNGEGGRLGHGDNNYQEYPTLIEALLGHSVVRIACGSSYSAAVTSQGELFTWGRGNYGRLGHGTNSDSNIPLLVETLKGVRIIDVACGCGDAQTLAVTDNGFVYSWGDGDYGKLGRGGSEGSKIPKLVETLRDVKISRAFCGAQFSVVLSVDGEVYTWGKGDNYQLGHGTEEHLRYPKKIPHFKGMKVKKVAVGVTHSIVLLENGNVYGWGKKEYAHPAESDVTGKIPELVSGIKTNNICGVACGVTQSFAWGAPNNSKIGVRFPFITDVSQNGMEKLNKLLTTVCGGVTVISDRPPSQEKECLIVTAFNILQLQLHAVSVNNVDVKNIGLDVGSALLTSIKQIVIDVASTSGVLDTIQLAAQATLQAGWSILLPTADERAKVLCSLLPSTEWNANNMSQSQHFMTDLLVSSLMTDGGLEISLQAAVKAEMSESIREESCNNSNNLSPIPLVQLVRQLLRNCLSQTLTHLQQLKPMQVTNVRSPSLTLLLRFQRLLIAQLYQHKSAESQYSWDCDDGNMGAELLLQKYLNHLITYVSQVLNTATEIACRSNKHFYAVSNILKCNGIDVLLPELLVCLVMLHEEIPLLLHSVDWLELFGSLFNSLENFNKLSPYLEKDDDEDMSWPGVTVNPCVYKSPEDMPYLKKMDIENHNRDGGLWVVYNNKVYDIQDSSEKLEDLENLRKYFHRDFASDIKDISPPPPELLLACYVGNYIDPDEEILQLIEVSCISSPLLDAQRTLAYLLGLHARYLTTGTPVLQTEKDLSKWLSALYLKGGLTPLSPFEEKDEARTTNTTPTEPVVSSSCSYTANFENPVNEPKLMDTVIAFDAYLTRTYEPPTILNLNANHPIEEVNKMLLAALIKHLGLGKHVLDTLMGAKKKYLEHYEIMANVLHKVKLKLIQMRQEQNQSYKELCVPFLNKLRFLLYEVKPATSHEVNAIDKLKLLYTETLFKRVAKQILRDIKCQKVRNCEKLMKAEKLKVMNEGKPKNQFFKDKKCHADVIVQPGKIELIHAIVNFLIEENSADIEHIRKAMSIQAERCSMHKKGYDFMLKLLSLPTIISSVKYNIINGWILTFSLYNAFENSSEYEIPKSIVTPHQRAELLLAKSKILIWAVDKLKESIRQTSNSFRFAIPKDKNGCYSQRKLCWIRLVLSVMGVLSEIQSGDELTLLVNSGICAHIEFILKESGLDSSSKMIISNDFDTQALFESDSNSVRYHITSPATLSTTVSSGPSLLPYIKPGLRVVRGPDWQWGDQNGSISGQGTVISSVSSDGWVPVKWDSGGRNTYRMGKDGKYDLQLAPPSDDYDDRCVENVDENTKDCESEKTKLRNPNEVLRKTCTSLLRILYLCAGAYADQIQPSCIQNLSHYLRQNFQKRTKQNILQLDSNRNEKWNSLGFVRTIAKSKSICVALSTPQWIDLLLQIISKQDTHSPYLITKLQALRLMQVVIPTGIEKEEFFEKIVEKLFLILGNIAIFCYPNLPLYKFAEKKTAVTLTATLTSTIIEEFVQLIRKIHSTPQWTDIFNAFLAKKLATATDILSHPLLTAEVENEEEITTIQYFSIATLLTLGGLDDRLRLGGDAIEGGLRSGTICSIKNKLKTVAVQMHETDKIEHHSFPFLKSITPLQFQLEKVPVSDSFLDTWATLLSVASLPYSHKSNNTALDLPLLRHQQQTLVVIRASRLLLGYQSRLRKVLKRPTLEPHMSLEALNDSDVIGNAAQSLLLHQLIVNAVQPSQLKPVFGRKELEEAAVNVSQYLAVDVYAKRVSTDNDRMRVNVNQVSNNDSARCPSPPLTPLMTQLVEMGFSKKSVETAVRATGDSAEPSTIENLVAWLLEYSEECRSLDRRLTIAENNSRISNNVSNMFSNAANLKQSPVVYKKRSDFTSADEYALYIRNHCAIGMSVRCCRSYEEEVYEGDTGVIVKINYGELHDLNLQVDWQMKGYAYWVRFIHVELLGNVNVLPNIKIGDTVRVKSSVVTPQYKWGSITHSSVGVVTAMNKNNQQVTVDFPQQTNWIGGISEMEVLPPHHQEIACSNCFMRPIVGPRFKCRVCENFNYCENCFYAPFDHQHNFVRIAEPGNAAIFAGRPRKIERSGLFTSLESDIIEDNASCIKYLTTSSRENWAHHLLDVHSNNYWQSCCASPEKHWIRLEICSDILIYSLKMKVEPSDTSYMPKLVKISAGNAFTELKELAVVSIHPRDTIVTVLSDVREYYPCVEISINQCVNGGVNCRVHAIYITGKRKCSADLPNSAPFLALDFNDTQVNAQCITEQTNFGVPLENKVFVWGLNDKDQLGGLKGSKIKFPAYSETLSALKPIHIAGGSKSLFIVSHQGKVYACGETTTGRLGLGTNLSSPVPRQIISLDQYIVKKVAVHSGGKHALALTLSGKVFSWGEGDDGKLGHGNSLSLDQPKMIEYFKSKRIKEIACGSSYSAAVTSCGELYTWGLGDYGRLGHGDSVTQYEPKLVRALLGRHVVKVACGSRDAQTLALDNEGMVYSWGDGDFGKLGRGGSETCDIPCNIEYLNGKGVIHIDCGAQFSLALTKSGQVWTWGKGDYYRLGNGTDQHVRKPTMLTALKSVHIVDCAAGALHCLAVSSTGVVYSWGDNDHGQQGNGGTMVNQKPTPVDDFGNVKVNRVACGSSHSVAWQAYEPPVCTSVEPVTLNAINDPLGANLLGIKEINLENEKKSSDFLNQPSLSKQILSLESDVWKQTALQYVLNSLKVMYARDAIIAAFSSSVKVESNISDEKDDLDDMALSNSNPLFSSVATIAHGGGEAPAPATESGDELVSSSNLTTPEDIDNPLNAFPSITSSSSTSHRMSVSRMSASTMSMIAATLKTNSQLIGITEKEMVNSSAVDDFISLLDLNDARILVDLLKLAVAGRVGENAKETLTNVLKVLASNDKSIAAMLLELCVIELEDVALNNNILLTSPQPVIQESAHPYNKQMTTTGVVRIPAADSLRIEFDRRCSTEKNRDTLTIYNPTRSTIYIMSGREWSDWSIPLFLQGEELRWKFTRDVKNNGWGWRFTVYPVMGKKQFGSDRDILSKPSMDVVMCLLDSCVATNEELIRRLVTALASCAQLNTLDGKERTWCLYKLCEFIHSPLKNLLHLPTLSQSEKEDSPLSNLLKALPKLLLKQYEYEDQYVKRGKQLMYSPFFKALVALACELELDMLPLCGETGKWAWFRHFCIACRVASALIHRSKIPSAFCLEVRKIIELDPCCLSEMSDDYENNELFTQEHDEQLLMWLNRKSDNWNISWSGSGVIYGWGHNHRGQLGGVNGNQIKIPTPCEALTALRPVQLAGGEQSLFAVTSEGRVYATGFADKGRLGIGTLPDWNPQNPFVNTPYLVEGLSKVFIKKVAVHSGGKHCLALSSTGSVYAWGDGEDGKLGLGHRNTCDTPCIVESLDDKEVIDISCGGAHSAAITNSGKLYTWGRGRYGRLGHGNGDDQLLPKLVEALLGYKVIDVACGSGDAQTLCITQDDNVWSWGDGDYGKLGRGGADGCSIPLKIECLAGLQVIKVECGSQFSVALTRSGSVYTWGKGDYFRLGHGTDEHVRRPRKVSGLQGKKIVSISTGSLHVVVCSNKGEVFAWGDNDEGQLGDGTLKAVPRPRAIPALQDKNITLVVCGSAHTFAKSSDKPISRGNNMPAQVPLEYDLLRDSPVPLLRNRLVLLHYFSDLLAPIVSMLPLEGEISLGKLRGILVYSAKEGLFRKVLNATMAREPHHGPTIDLNRIQVKRSRIKGGYAGPDGVKSVFGQMVQKSFLTKESLLLPHRVWKVQFVGESVDDYGGGYSESITEMCEELQNGSLPVLIPTPNGRDDTGTNRDCFILNPDARSPLHMNMFNFLGVLMGIAIRTGSPLSLNLAESVWKQLAGMTLTIADLTEIDKDYIPGLLFIRDMDPNEKNSIDIPFSTISASGKEVFLSATHRRVTANNKHEYIRLALNYRLHEFDNQVAAVRAGLARVVPVPLLSLFSGYELETMVCGSPDIPLELLKSVAVYKGISATDKLVQWFWDVMEEFTNQERSLFLRFVWGRTRLPRTIADFRGRDFVLQVMDKYSPPDHFLPESYTCFFLLKMPRYSNKFVLREKLKYAIYFCKSIDTDEYARIAIPGTGLTSSNSDSDGFESITGEEITPT